MVLCYPLREIFLVTIALSVLQSINILKAHGHRAKDSYMLNGYALNTGRAAQGMPTRVTPARTQAVQLKLQLCLNLP